MLKFVNRALRVCLCSPDHPVPGCANIAHADLRYLHADSLMLARSVVAGTAVSEVSPVGVDPLVG